MSQHWYLDRSSHPLPSLSQADDPIQHSTQQQYQNPVEGTEYQHSYRIAPSRSDEIYHRRSLSHNHSLEAGRRMKDDGLRNHGSGFQLASPSNAESPPSHASMSQSLSGNEAASSSMSSAQHLGQYSFGYHPSGRYLLPGLPRHARLSDHGQRANTPISHRSGREAHPLPLAMQPPPTAALRQKGRSSNQGHADKHWWSSRASPIDEARLGSTERRNPVNRTSGPHPANSFQIMTNYSSSQPGKDASHLQQDLGTQVGSPCNAQECVTGCVRDLPLRLGNELKTRNQRKRRAEIDDQAESAPPLRQNGGEVGRDGSDAEVSSQSEREGPSRGIQEKDQNGSKEGASGRTKRRKRAILSCTECKQRKIKCDRNVPNCSSCVRRGVAHLCKWGDERDTIANEKGSGISPSNAALMARIAQLEAQIRALQSAGRGAESDRLRAGEKAATPRSMTSSAEKEATSAIAGESVGSHFREESRSSSSPWYPQPGRTMEQPKLEDPNEEACSRPSWRMLKHPSELCSQSFRKDAPKDPYQSEESDAPDSGTDDAAVVFHALAKGHSLSKDQEREIRRVPLCDKGSIREKNSQGRPGGNVREPSTSTCQASNFPGTEIFLGDHLVARQTEQDNGSRGHPDSRDSSSGAAQTGSTPSNDAGIEEATHEEMIRILLGATNFPFAPIPDALDAFSSSKVDYMLKLLPSTEQVNQLVRFYIRVAEPMVNCLHVPLFFSQLESFWQVANERRAGGKVVASQGHAPANPVPKPMPDISFLALLFCMIAASCEYLTPKEIIAAGVCLQRSTISEKLTLYHHCVRALLSMVNVMWEPSLCTLQTIIIMRQYCFNRRKREEYISLQTMVLKAAEGLGLHRLGSAHDDEARWRDESLEAQKTSPDSSLRKMIRSTRHFKDGSETDSEEEEGLDPVRHDLNGMWLPKGSQRSNWDLNHTKRFEDGNRVARELGRKVWFALVTMDWMFAIQLNRCYYAREEMFTTELPLNLDDEDVWEGNELSKEGSPRSPGNHLVSQPVEVPTQNSFIRVQVEICYAVRGIVDALNRNEESYDHVLLLDSRLRSILDSLPKFFRLDGSSEYDPEILEHHRRRPYLSLQRVAIYETVHHRLLMLHRLFMGRGYLNPKYAFSTRTCIESARAVISSLKSLDQVNCYGRKYWLFKYHLFHALLALQVDLLYLSREPLTEEIAEKRADVVHGLKILHSMTDVEGRNVLLASSLKVIKTLREEERARRAAQGGEKSKTDSRCRDDHSGSQVSARPRSPTDASKNSGSLASRLGEGILATWGSSSADHGMNRVQRTDSSLGKKNQSYGNPVASAHSLPAADDDDQVVHVVTVTEAVAGDGRGSGVSSSACHSELLGDAKFTGISATSGCVLAAAGQDASPLATGTDDPEGYNTELDQYLRLLSSYQNPGDIPDGNTLFSILDDIIPRDPAHGFANSSLTSHILHPESESGKGFGAVFEYGQDHTNILNAFLI